jgi:hypothetical protein
MKRIDFSKLEDNTILETREIELLDTRIKVSAVFQRKFRDGTKIEHIIIKCEPSVINVLNEEEIKKIKLIIKGVRLSKKDYPIESLYSMNHTTNKK